MASRENPEPNQARIAVLAAAAPLSMKKTLEHRTRVGADRREKMRMRLIESAMLVFAGPD